MQVKLKPCEGEACNGKLRVIWKQHENKRLCQTCWNKIKPQIPIKKSTLPKSQKPISKRSDKKIKQDALYSMLRAAFLKNHKYCEAKASFECRNKSDQVHHMAGKVGDLYLDDSKFLAVCGPCHRRITDFPAEAIENGWSLLRLNN